MTLLDQLATSDAPVVMDLITTPDLSLPFTVGASWDNRPTWDNWQKTPSPFDNRPTWDNWSKKS